MPVIADVAERKIRLGHITGVFGVQGWVKVHSDTDPRQNIVKYREWFLHDPQAEDSGTERRVRVLSGKPQGKTIIARLDGIDSPEQALALRGLAIFVNRSALPALSDGEFYWADIIGFAVQDTEGVLLGCVDRLFETGANDVMVVRPANTGMVAEDATGEARRAGKPLGEAEILVPWVKDSVILAVDMDGRVIHVDWDPDY